MSPVVMILGGRDVKGVEKLTYLKISHTAWDTRGKETEAWKSSPPSPSGTPWVHIWPIILDMGKLGSGEVALVPLGWNGLSVTPLP